jgi:hypothetical protein
MVIERRETMWSLADRMVKAVSNVTVGTVIVLVHVALADRNARKQQQPRAPHLAN